MSDGGMTGRPSAIPGPMRILIPAGLGAIVSVTLGVYSKVHDPTGESIATFGFSGMLNMKAWLTTLAAILAFVQLTSALRLYGKIGSGAASGWVSITHRLSGVLAVLVTLPVAYHCLWSLGFSAVEPRTLVHSLLGCAFYGVFAAKMLTLRVRRLPGWALPLFGGLAFSAVIGIWLSSSLWFFSTVGFPEF
jgi:hypothetical protein